MDTRDLKIFYTVAKLQSFSKAAAEMDYVQSNITLRIQKLEEELQTKLFERTNRGVRLLPAGELLLSYADNILALMDEAVEAIRPSSEVTIGAPQSLTAALLPKYLLAMKQQHPAISVRIKTLPAAELLTQLKQHRIDLAITNRPYQDPTLKTVHQYKESLYLVSGETACIKQALNLPAVVSSDPECPFRQALLLFIASQQAEPADLIEYDMLEPILYCVEQNSGITVLPEHLVRHPMQKHLLSKDIGEIKIQFVVNAKGARKKSVHSLLACIKSTSNERTDSSVLSQTT
ncbi:MAG: LysR family transcriptional regulator [Paenibacillus sp.]|nr:LysR family transcriptional regulator [Paenibacillus sp.]